jgi:peptidoglycan/LPS O-acetylase OafA/YrhL
MESSTAFSVHKFKDSSSPPSSDVPRVYFKNLDGLRFVAALMVILQHLSDYKRNKPGIPNLEGNLVSNLGSHGVTLFFVLSGFLIFSLLFVEKKFTDTIQVKSFYVRRMLRIWPLYFGFGILSIVFTDKMLTLLGNPINTPVGENLLYLFTFSVNLQLIFAVVNKGIIELYWSVCIEEQFYLFAPWLVKKGNNFLMISLVLIGVGIGSKFLLEYLITKEIIQANQHINPLYTFTTCWFDAFGLGILAAYFYFNKNIYNKIRSVIENKSVQATVLIFTFLYVTDILPRPKLITNYFFSTIACLCFAYIILAAATGKFIFNLETPFLKRMGKYSYGMYVLHATVIQLVLIFFLKYFSKENLLVYEIIFPLLSVALVILLSGLSYELYEKRFLKMKKSFTVVQNQKL